MGAPCTSWKSGMEQKPRGEHYSIEFNGYLIVQKQICAFGIYTIFLILFTELT
jgi:hypothetical protein